MIVAAPPPAFHERGFCVAPAPGWHARAFELRGATPTVNVSNFPFGRVEYLSGNDDPKLRWPRGGILITVHDWTAGATAAMRPEFPRTTLPLRLAPRDFASFEGIRVLGRRQVRIGGRLLEVWVQARPTTRTTIARANRALARVRPC